jgi:hypothetical protein
MPFRRPTSWTSAVVLEELSFRKWGASFWLLGAQPRGGDLWVRIESSRGCTHSSPSAYFPDGCRPFITSSAQLIRALNPVLDGGTLINAI